MNRVRQACLPDIIPDTDPLTFTNPFGRVGEDSRRPIACGCSPRRIKGQFCPFCAGRIPEEHIFCTHCGRNV